MACTPRRQRKSHRIYFFHLRSLSSVMEGIATSFSFGVSPGLGGLVEKPLLRDYSGQTEPQGISSHLCDGQGALTARRTTQRRPGMAKYVSVSSRKRLFGCIATSVVAINLRFPPFSCEDSPALVRRSVEKKKTGESPFFKTAGALLLLRAVGKSCVALDCTRSGHSDSGTRGLWRWT